MLALLPDRPPPIYEIRLRGEMPPALRDQFPTLRIHRCRVETVLSRDVTDLAELDVLLEQLQSLGVVISEIRGAPAAGPSPPGSSPLGTPLGVTVTDRAFGPPAEEGGRPVVRSYEVRVEGRLGAALLHHLRWSYRVQLDQSVVRLSSCPDDLAAFLAGCADGGLTVDRVTRLDPVPGG